MAVQTIGILLRAIDLMNADAPGYDMGRVSGSMVRIAARVDDIREALGRDRAGRAPPRVGRMGGRV